MKTNRPDLALLGGFILSVATAFAQSPPAVPPATNMGELARKLNDPTATIYSLPLQNNFDWGGGPTDDGFQYKLNIQPVIPIGLNERWKLLTRYVVPLVYQENLVGTSWQEGLADSTATFWLAPAKEKPGEPTWGIGPVLQLPTATEDLLGAGKWGAGPSVILLKQQSGWTYGFLANQVWSFAGDSDRDYVSYLFAQPFLNHTNAKHTTFGVDLEAIYDWNHEHWTVPVNVYVNQLVLMGKMPVTFQLGARYYVEKPAGGPDWGLRFGITLVFK